MYLHTYMEEKENNLGIFINTLLIHFYILYIRTKSYIYFYLHKNISNIFPSYSNRKMLRNDQFISCKYSYRRTISILCKIINIRMYYFYFTNERKIHVNKLRYRTENWQKFAKIRKNNRKN